MEPDPAQFRFLLILVWLSLPLIFVGAASLVNALIRRKVINGALIYLVLAASVFAFGAWRAFSNPANTSFEAGEQVGSYTVWFGIPMSIALYFANRFSNKRRAEITERQQARGLLNPSLQSARTTDEIEPPVTGQGTGARDGRDGLEIAARRRATNRSRHQASRVCRRRPQKVCASHGLGSVSTR